MNRRAFLQFLAADAAIPITQQLASAANPYQVGIGSSTDPYTATQRAVSASGQFPASAIAGKTVMIKPNLVTGHVASTGVTTDPQVVRAIVDLTIQAGASQVFIVEGGIGTPANFAACGYNLFNAYNSIVQLMDFSTQPVSLVQVPYGMTWQQLYLPTPAVQPNIVFISAAKLKTHASTGVTLSMKNLFGLPVPQNYNVPGALLARQGCHLRGIDQTVIDINLVRPISYAVIDGMWGMQGQGPLSGQPIQRNLVLAGLNPVALDRVAMNVMQITQTVPHLDYAAQRRMGPPTIGYVSILGDSYTPFPFTPAKAAPIVWRPTVAPNPVSIASGPNLTVYYQIPAQCYIRVEIIQDDEAAPAVQLVRTLQDWTVTQPGTWHVAWDGKDNNGAVVAPGTYFAHVMGYDTVTGVTHTTGRIRVNS